MTRFARAKGSKASNERVPEEATSWAEMKQQLIMKRKEIEDSKNRQEILNQRNANYKAFLEEKEESESKKTTWVDFPATKLTSPTKQIKKSTSSQNYKYNRSNSDKSSSEDEEFTQLMEKVDRVLEDLNKSESNSGSSSNGVNIGKDINNTIKHLKTSKQKKVKSITGNQSVQTKQMNKNSTSLSLNPAVLDCNKSDSDSDAPPEEHTAKEEVVKPIIIKKPKQKKSKIVIDRNLDSKRIENKKEVIKQSKRKSSLSENENNGKKKFKKDRSQDEDGSVGTKNADAKVKPNNGNQKKKIVKENLTEKDLIKIEKKKQRRLKQVLKKKKIKAELKQEENIEEKQETVSNEINKKKITNRKSPEEPSSKSGAYKKDISKKQVGQNNKLNRKTKQEKVNNNEEHSRKKPFLPHKMFINGKELEIEYVDGFPVRKEDSERLKKLRREMISKGLPRSEINIAMKLERRKAEKALAREKKKVCFNCRKSGHNLSECPELNKDQVAETAGSGICFKCGSTEHTHFECKVVRGQQFNFAQCFICQEQGHIARQCPDNARGLYPKGGACNVCGDVTHLKKDCPRYQAQQQRHEDGLKIETFGDSNPDILEQTNGDSDKKVVSKKPNKIIKF